MLRLGRIVECRKPRGSPVLGQPSRIFVTPGEQTACPSQCQRMAVEQPEYLIANLSSDSLARERVQQVFRVFRIQRLPQLHALRWHDLGTHTSQDQSAVLG